MSFHIPKTDRIFLLGMPSAGKSTFGKALSGLLGWNFTDLDACIEAVEGHSIPEIFAQNGEGYFREVERRVLRETLPLRHVVATGGGTPCFFDNMDFLKQHGICLFLEVPTEVLAKRSLQQHGQRPLLKEATDLVALQKLLHQKYQQRIPFYRQADIIVGQDEQQAATALEKIQRHFPNFTV